MYLSSALPSHGRFLGTRPLGAIPVRSPQQHRDSINKPQMDRGWRHEKINKLSPYPLYRQIEGTFWYLADTCLIFFLSHRTLLRLSITQGPESEVLLHVLSLVSCQKGVYSSESKDNCPCAGTVQTQGPSCPVQVRVLITTPPSLLTPKSSPSPSGSTEWKCCCSLTNGPAVAGAEQNHPVQAVKTMSDCSTRDRMKATCLSLVISMQKWEKDRDQSLAFDPYSFNYNSKVNWPWETHFPVVGFKYGFS